MEHIREYLLAEQEEAYRDFMKKLLPTVSEDYILGIRTPILRTLARQLIKEEETKTGTFLADLPHLYFEENQLHGFLISDIRDFETCIRELDRFLPYIDNWATCDQTSPKVFRKHKEELLSHIHRWLGAEHTYTVRFAIGMLMQHYLDDAFRPEYLDLVSGIQSGDYYVNMEIAWYMATALAKQWEAAIPYLQERRMKPWVHNRTIRKACESRRITQEQKAYLKMLK